MSVALAGIDRFRRQPELRHGAIVARKVVVRPASGIKAADDLTWPQITQMPDVDLIAWTELKLGHQNGTSSSSEVSAGGSDWSRFEPSSSRLLTTTTGFERS